MASYQSVLYLRCPIPDIPIIHLNSIQQGALTMTKPPYILIKTWLEIYFSNNTQSYKEAQSVVEKLILKHFNSVYEAEMYLFKLEQSK